MTVIAGVRVEYDPLVRYVRPKHDCRPGERLIIQTEFGDDIATVVISYDKEPRAKRQEFRIVRQATAEDIERCRANREEAREGLRVAREKAAALRLPMNLLYAHYLSDRSKLLLFFVAENRVDFRELVRDLAVLFHTRIELRQVSPREGTKITGGVGVCGLKLCCNSFNIKFDSISLKCARDQNLSSNIAKLMGVCGKPYCCLIYENAQYIQMTKMFPKINAMVRVSVDALPDKMKSETDLKEIRGIVRDFNVIKNTVFLRLETEAFLEVPLEAVKW
jgi:cell fate regulator YaaT (PSP1 superfamily)